MKRHSVLWWLVMLPTSVIVGGTTFLLARHFTDLNVLSLVGVAAVSALVADLAIAVAMEAIAPTKVHIGPGEKVLDSELPSEQATIIAGFDFSPHGQVSVRGEIWRAVRAPGDTGVLSKGLVVSVVDRNGLTLVVSAGSA